MQLALGVGAETPKNICILYVHAIEHLKSSKQVLARGRCATWDHRGRCLWKTSVYLWLVTPRDQTVEEHQKQPLCTSDRVTMRWKRIRTVNIQINISPNAVFQETNDYCRVVMCDKLIQWKSEKHAALMAEVYWIHVPLDRLTTSNHNTNTLRRQKSATTKCCVLSIVLKRADGAVRKHKKRLQNELKKTASPKKQQHPLYEVEDVLKMRKM